jgi:thiol-disulfide isomerase/thioredoxin
VVAAVAKLADRAGTRTTVEEFGAPRRIAGFLAIALPIVELIVAALILYDPTQIAGAAGAIALLTLFSVAVSVRLAKGHAPSCNCFGQLKSAPVSWKTIVRNGVLALLAAIALSAGIAGETPSTFGWIRTLGEMNVIAVVGAAMFLVLAVAGLMAFIAVLRSHGQLLLRVDELEQRLTAAGFDTIAQTQPEFGLAPGTVAPSFTSKDADDATVSLDDLLTAELPVLLLFSSSGCSPCKTLMPSVSEWQNQHPDRLTIAIANGAKRDARNAEAKEHGLKRVLDDEDLALYKAYQASGTPSAVLIAADGTIASYVATGTDAITELLDFAIAEPYSEPAALPVGAEVPELIVRTLAGDDIDLARVQEKSLLVFWNPGCGYCSSMRDDLLAWERNPPAGAPRLFIVTSGDEAATRAEGFASTVVLDTGFGVGGVFGAHGTPMGILLDSKGRVASKVTAGADALFALIGGRARSDRNGEARIAAGARR